MAALQITCLGDCQITLNGTPLRVSLPEKTRALLIYLALTPQVHQRSHLTHYFWAGYSAESARNSLRQALYQVRHYLSDPDSGSERTDEIPWLLVTRQTVQINPAAPITVDVTTFMQWLAATRSHDHADLATCTPCLTRLHQAIALYQNDFLAAFNPIDSAPFEEWRHITCEQLQLELLDALRRLANAAESAGDIGSAGHAAYRHLALEPWSENAHRRIMRLRPLLGQQAAAIAQYHHNRQVLAERAKASPTAKGTERDEQGQQSSSEQPTHQEKTLEADEKHQAPNTESATSDPQEEARKASTGTQHLAHNAAPPRMGPLLHDWVEMPSVDLLTGRAAELAQVTAWLTAPREANAPPVQLIALLGIGGIGKTTLAAAAVKAVAPHFSTVIWRSLLNAPPLAQLLRQWLQLLSRQTLTALPSSRDEQLRLLLSYLQQERCLLVLDNLESILAEDDPHGRAGTARPGYEGYEQLLQRLASSEHQSCLLLTSREQPYVLAHLGRPAQEHTPGPSGRCRVLSLTGLDPQAGSQLLQSNGLAASATEATQLVEGYSGNPLALQIVAATIVDFFDGDVAAFRREAGGLFGGIRLVLDQQMARLSPLERDLLFWLAIEREAVAVPTLRRNLMQPVSTQAVLEALRALQNRSLLERRNNDLTLQNVIIEYCTAQLVEQVGREIEEVSMANAGIRDDQLATRFLNRFALLKAQSKTYVRESQARLLLAPLAARLVATLGKAEVVARIPRYLDALRTAQIRTGYAAGNLLNLLVQIGEDLSGYDFSALAVWQADLRGLLLAAPNFTNADLTNSTFTTDISVNQVTFQATGELLIANISNSRVCLWCTSAGQLKAAFQLERNSRNPLCFSPDGRYIAAASIDYQIRIWATHDGGLVQTLTGHNSLVLSLAFSADHRYLASGTAESTVIVWELASGQPRYRLDGHEQSVPALLFSPDGQRLVTGSGTGQIRIWDLASTPAQGQLVATLVGHTHAVGTLACSPDGRWLLSGSHDGDIRLWDLTHDGAYVQNFPGHRSIIRALSFQPLPTPAPTATPLPRSAYLFASASSDQTARLWSLTGEVRYTLLGHQHEVIGLSFSSDGRQLVSAGADQCIYWWDVQSGQAYNRLRGHLYGPNSVAFSPDQRLVASGSADQLVRLWPISATGTRPVQSPRYHLLRGHTHYVRAVAFSPSGALIASSSHDRTVRIWDVPTRQERYTLTGHTGHILALAWAPAQNTTLLLASAGADRTIRLWPIAEKSPADRPQSRRLVGHEDEILCLTFDPTGTLLVSGSMDGTVRIWQVATGVTQHRLTGHTSPVTSVTISPDGSTLATSSFDHTIRLWDLATGACLHVEQNKRVGPLAVKFGCFPGGDELLVYGGNDYAIYLWRWRTTEPPVALQGHSSHVLALDCSRTAPFLVSCGSDNTLRLWDLTTYQCVQVLDDPGPYAGMQITGLTGISEAQKATLKALGAVEA